MLDDPKLQEVKDQIEEVKEMKEKLNYVYFNKQWKDWRREFARLEEFRTMGDGAFERCIDDLLMFIEESQRQRNKVNLYRKLAKKSTLEGGGGIFDEVDLTKESSSSESPEMLEMELPLGGFELEKKGSLHGRRNQLMNRQGGSYRHTLLRVEE